MSLPPLFQMVGVWNFNGSRPRWLVLIGFLLSGVLAFDSLWVKILFSLALSTMTYLLGLGDTASDFCSQTLKEHIDMATAYDLPRVGRDTAPTLAEVNGVTLTFPVTGYFAKQQAIKELRRMDILPRGAAEWMTGDIQARFKDHVLFVDRCSDILTESVRVGRLVVLEPPARHVLSYDLPQVRPPITLPLPNPMDDQKVLDDNPVDRCAVCFENRAIVVLLPCAHAMFCATCAARLIDDGTAPGADRRTAVIKCPICSAQVLWLVRIFQDPPRAQSVKSAHLSSPHHRRQRPSF